MRLPFHRFTATVSPLILSTLLAVAAQAQEAAPTNPSVLKAQTWDMGVVIGPGAYRGGKILSKGKPKHAVRPGAMIDKVEFATDGNANWTIEGALLRGVRIHGDLSTRLDAKDTAFEECLLSKSGGWFVGWAGTKWRFENCVFTRSFMPASLGVHDYSVRAVRCTFVGIKMPRFNLKKDPSQGLQGDDLQFVNCKFVGCEIPETMLALTVDCTFENCEFEKKPYDWEKAKTPIAVKAFIPSGPTPASYTNTKLSVTFAPGAPAQPTGATLPHTLAGPRILLPWAQALRTSIEIGDVKKPASEIPVLSPVAETQQPPNSSPNPGVASAARPPIPTPPLRPSAPVNPPPAPPMPATAGQNLDFFNLPANKPAAPSAPVQPPPPTTPAVAGSNPLVPPKPVAAASPTPREVKSLDELFLTVPLGQDLVTAGRVNPAALDAANAAIAQGATGKPISLRITVEELLGYREDGYAFKLRSQPQVLTLRGQPVTARVQILFRADQAAGLGRLGKGSVIPIKGTIGTAELTGERRAITFTVLVTDGTLP